MTKVLLSVAVVVAVLIAGGLSSQRGRVVETTTQDVPAAASGFDLPAIHLPSADASPHATEDGTPAGDLSFSGTTDDATSSAPDGIRTPRTPSAGNDGSSVQFAVSGASQPTVCKGHNSSDSSSENGRRLREHDSHTRCTATNPDDDCTEGDCEEEK